MNGKDWQNNNDCHRPTSQKLCLANFSKQLTALGSYLISSRKPRQGIGCTYEVKEWSIGILGHSTTCPGLNLLVYIRTTSSLAW